MRVIARQRLASFISHTSRRRLRWSLIGKLVLVFGVRRAALSFGERVGRVVFQLMHGNPHFRVCPQPDIILLAMSFIIDRRS